MSIFADAQRRLCRGTVLTQLDDWTDWLAVGLQDQQLVWRKASASRLHAPFFTDQFLHQTQAERQLHLRPLQDPPMLYSGYASLAPRALVFHSSRCGSTLLMQMLATDPRFLAISEPPLLDVALSAWYHGKIGRIGFTHALQALCLQRQPEQQYAVIKTDCWHLPQLPLLRQIFPHTPALFIFREPAEILASHARQTGPQMIPGMLDLAMLGLKERQAEWDYASWPDFLLTHLYEVAARLHQSEGLRLINYRELPQALWQTLLPEWQISCNAAELVAMQQRSQRHAKSGLSWHGDPGGEACMPSPRLRAAYQHLLDLAALPMPVHSLQTPAIQTLPQA